MNIKEALLFVREHRHFIAVYEECIAHLRKVEFDGMEIPVETDEEGVDQAYVDAVIEELESRQAEHEKKIAEIEKLEVESARKRKGVGRKSSGRARSTDAEPEGAPVG